MGCKIVAQAIKETGQPHDADAAAAQLAHSHEDSQQPLCGVLRAGGSPDTGAWWDAGFVGCKMVAKWPGRVASLTMLSTTQCGWHMAAQMMKRPWVTLKVHPGPCA